MRIEGRKRRRGRREEEPKDTRLSSVGNCEWLAAESGPAKSGRAGPKRNERKGKGALSGRGKPQKEGAAAGTRERATDNTSLALALSTQQNARKHGSSKLILTMKQ